MFSIRVSASRALFACTVEIEPSWPVFIACSMSNASTPRTSPTMIRSGRMRSAFHTRSRCVDVARAFEIRRPGLQADHVRLLKLQLRRILDGDDALAVIDELAHGVQAASSCRNRCRRRPER